jgi:hypothetical protein
MLGNLSSILDKTSAHTKAKKIDQGTFVNARLVPDMYPLSRQIQISADMAKACAARLAGIEVPHYEDNETTLAELQARIAKTIAFLQSVDIDQIDGSEERTVTIKMPTRKSFIPASIICLILSFPISIFTSPQLTPYSGIMV